MAMHTRELTGPALDWAVAVAAGRTPTLHKESPQAHGYVTVENGGAQLDWNPGTDWRVAGPIIEREHINTIKVSTGPGRTAWGAAVEHGQQTQYDSEFSEQAFYFFFESEVVRGPTLLVAAMRCFVASKLGAEIDLPGDLQ